MVSKKEKVVLDKSYATLGIALGGLRNLTGLPAAIFTADLIKDAIAVKEARKMGITVIAICDSNVDPDMADYPIPANDDARKSIEYIVSRMAEACKRSKVAAPKVETTEAPAATVEA